VSNATPATNSVVTITWSIRGAQTAIAPNQRSRDGLLTIAFQSQSPACTPAITSQPGTDASVRLVSENVDASGTGQGSADLSTGSTPGPIVVRISCVSGATADITVLVQGASSPPAQQPSTPQQPPTGQAPGGQAPAGQAPSGPGAGVPRPPQTGSLGESNGGPSGLPVGLTLLSLLALSTVLVGARLVTRRK
jgi:hypothetical protein